MVEDIRTYTAGRRALHVKNTPGHPSVPLPTPHPLPCLSLTLQEGGWVRNLDLATMADSNHFHDAHEGNVLLSLSGVDFPEIRWHDFGGSYKPAGGLKKQQSTAANPSRALGFDAFQLWVVPSPSCQGRLLRIHAASQPPPAVWVCQLGSPAWLPAGAAGAA